MQSLFLHILTGMCIQRKPSPLSGMKGPPFFHHRADRCKCKQVTAAAAWRSKEEEGGRPLSRPSDPLGMLRWPTDTLVFSWRQLLGWRDRPPERRTWWEHFYPRTDFHYINKDEGRGHGSCGVMNCCYWHERWRCYVCAVGGTSVCAKWRSRLLLRCACSASWWRPGLMEETEVNGKLTLSTVLYISNGLEIGKR